MNLLHVGCSGQAPGHRQCSAGCLGLTTQVELVVLLSRRPSTKRTCLHSHTYPCFPRHCHPQVWLERSQRDCTLDVLLLEVHTHQLVRMHRSLHCAKGIEIQFKRHPFFYRHESGAARNQCPASWRVASCQLHAAIPRPPDMRYSTKAHYGLTCWRPM